MAKNRNRLHSVQGESPDPFLRAFLRQAVAIITVERGINESSTSKLQVLADQLGLSNETFQKALDQLKQPDSVLGLNRYEKKYVERLEREFEKVSGKVLNIRSEQTLVDLAESRFQINAVRAHQLIQKTAQRFNVGIISHSDAEQFAIQLIEDKVDHRTALEHSETSRLYKACEKWGFDKQKVDQVVRRVVSRNQAKRRKSLLRLCVAAVVLAVLLGGATYALSLVDWKNLLMANRLDDQPSLELVNSPLSYPGWWDASMIAAAQAVAQYGDRQSRLIMRLIDADTAKTQKIYQDLIDDKLDRSQLDIELAAFLAIAHIRDPDQANAGAIVAAVEKWIRLPVDSPASARQIRKSVAATKLFSFMLFESRKERFSAANSRNHRLEKLNETYFGVKERQDRDSYFNEAIENLTIDQWAHALRNCAKYPKDVASFLHELEQREVQDHSSVNEIRARVVKSILSIDPTLWRTFRNSIVKTIQESNPVLKESWTRFSAGLPESIIKELIDENLESSVKLRSGERVAGSKTSNSAGNVSLPDAAKSLQTRNRIELRILDLENKLRIANIRLSDNRTLPTLDWEPYCDLIFRLTKTNNVLLAWQKFKAGVGSLEEVNLLLTEADSHSNIFDPNPDSHRWTAFENRRLQSAFDKIFDSNENQVSTRITAFEEIEQLSTRFPHVDYGAAKKLVDHIFSPMSVRESLALERLLPQVSHWANLQLAIADMLEAKRGERDKLQDTLGLLQVTVNLESAQDWRKEAGEALLQNSLSLLENQTIGVADQWQRLQQYFDDIKIIRVGMVTNDRTNDSIYAQLNNWLSAKFVNAKYWLRRVEMIAECNDELESTASLNRLLIRLYCNLEELKLDDPGFKRKELTLGQVLLETELSFYKTLTGWFDESDAKNH